MKGTFTVTVVAAARLSPTERQAIISLCTHAFEEDFTALFETFHRATHVVAQLGPSLVSHALWVTRRLQVASSTPMRTAYVEAVATHKAHRGCGYASRVMNRLRQEIIDHDLGGLSPSDPGFYQTLGWELWQGPLFIRKSGKLLPSPQEEQVMIIRLPGTPALDLTAPLSAEWREGELW